MNQSLQNASDDLVRAKTLIIAGDNETDDVMTISDYKTAAANAATSASASMSAVSDFAAMDSDKAGHAAAVQSLLQSANASLVEAQKATDQGAARSAAVAATTAADAAFNYANDAKPYNWMPLLVVGGLVSAAAGAGILWRARRPLLSPRMA